MPSYVPPFAVFPWPENLGCGAPYINWPSSQDILSSQTLKTEVAVPESWIEVGGNMNRTKQSHSLILTRERIIRRDTTRFLPIYRGRNFTTPDDRFTRPDTCYLKYLGPPSAHSTRDHKFDCDVTYHLLSYAYEPSVLANYKLARAESDDWLFQLFAGDLNTSKPYEMPTTTPITQTELLKACDARGKHYKYMPGGAGKCDFDKPTNRPTAVPTSSPQDGGYHSGPVLRLAVWLPLGILWAFALVGLVVHFVPRFRRRLRGEGAIQL